MAPVDIFSLLLLLPLEHEGSCSKWSPEQREEGGGTRFIQLLCPEGSFRMKEGRKEEEDSQPSEFSVASFVCHVSLEATSGGDYMANMSESFVHVPLAFRSF